MPARFIRAYPPAQPTSSLAYWFPFRSDKVLMHETEQGIVPLEGGEELRDLIQPVQPDKTSWLYIGTLDGVPCMTVDMRESSSLKGIEDVRELSIRELYGRVDETIHVLVMYAMQLLYWQRTSNFCPVCGHVPVSEEGTWGKRCPNCGHVAYPHVTPAILALVHDDNGNMLLTHKRGWGKRFSCVAGFTEPGESLEECVKREIYEELGVEVSEITYIGSQPWPFPHQLMVGYTARYVGGEIRIQEQELDDARWFSIKEPPEMPPPMSLAHTIIKTWMEKHM